MQARASQIADFAPCSKRRLLAISSGNQSPKSTAKASVFPKNNSGVLDTAVTLRAAAKTSRTTPLKLCNGGSSLAVNGMARRIDTARSSVYPLESPVLKNSTIGETCVGPLVSQSVDGTWTKSLDRTRLTKHDESGRSSISSGLYCGMQSPRDRRPVHDSCDKSQQEPSLPKLKNPLRDIQGAASNPVLPFNKSCISNERIGNPELGKRQINITKDDLNDISTQDFLSEEGSQIWITQQHEAEMKGTSSCSSQSKTKKLSQGPKEIQNLPVASPLQSLSEFIHNGIRLNPKANAELKNGDFMRIVDVIRDPATGDIFLRGWIFRRTRHMNGILEKKYNELCWILHVDEDDARDASVQAMESVPVTDVVRRRKIRLTNQAFPAFSFREDGMHDNEQTVLNERVLVCRFKYICTYLNSTMRDRYTWSEKALHRLRAEECDSSLAKEDEKLRYDWRGRTDVGGACSSMSTEEKQFMQHEYQNQDALCMTHENIDHSPGTENLASPIRGLWDSQTAAYHSTPDLIKEPDSTAEATMNFIDLTEDTTDSPSSAWSDMPSVVNASGLTGICQSVRGKSPEVVMIEAIIKTTTNSGTLQKIYEGQVTTTFTPHSLPQRKHNCLSEDEQPTADSRKRRKTHSKRQERRWHNENAVLREPLSSSGCNERSGACSGDDSESMGLFEHPYHSPKLSCAANDNVPRSQGTSDTGIISLEASPRAVLAPSASNVLTSPSESKMPTDNFTPGLPKQRYTFGDCFCGAGGVSRGAVQAGLRVEWGFDCNTYACNSYGLNNPFTSVYPLWAHDFCNQAQDRDFKVDICHLSPPCQFFSDAHTIMGKNDDVNTASLFAISELVKKAKPRVVTLELRLAAETRDLLQCRGAHVHFSGLQHPLEDPQLRRLRRAAAENAYLHDCILGSKPPFLSSSFLIFCMAKSLLS